MSAAALLLGAAFLAGALLEWWTRGGTAETPHPASRPRDDAGRLRAGAGAVTGLPTCLAGVLMLLGAGLPPWENGPWWTKLWIALLACCGFQVSVLVAHLTKRPGA